MITFEEMHRSEIYTSHNQHYDDNARYFKIIKENNVLCIYGTLIRNNNIVEAFWILDSFEENTLSKSFFKYLFNHCFSLGYKEIYTWTRCQKLKNLFIHFKKFGIEKIECPTWDNDPTKTWFRKRV